VGGAGSGNPWALSNWVSRLHVNVNNIHQSDGIGTGGGVCLALPRTQLLWGLWFLLTMARKGSNGLGNM